MKVAIVLTALLTMGCASQSQTGSDYFGHQAEFAANRAREVITLDALDYDSACIQVTEVLMDMQCALRKSSQPLGVISAAGSRRQIRSESLSGAFGAVQDWGGCIGSDVTVTIEKIGEGRVAIRPVFVLPSADRDRTFRILLENSLALDPAGKSENE